MEDYKNPYLSKSGNVDLRKIGKRKINDDLMMSIEYEILVRNKNKISIVIDPETQVLTIWGQDKDGRKLTEKYGVKEYLKLSRRYERRFKHVERERNRLGITTHELPNIYNVIAKQSVGSKIKGLTNVIKTADKLVRKEEQFQGRTRLQETAINERRLLKARYEAFDNPLAMIKEAHPNFDYKKYYTKTGRFRSKRLETEFYRLFANTIKDEDNVGSPPPGSTAELITDIYERFVPSEMTSKQYLDSLSDIELKNIVKEVQEERLMYNIERRLGGEEMTESEGRYLSRQLSQYKVEFETIEEEEELASEVYRKLRNR